MKVSIDGEDDKETLGFNITAALIACPADYAMRTDSQCRENRERYSAPVAGKRRRECPAASLAWCNSMRWLSAPAKM